MEKFKLIGVRLFKKSELIQTTYFKIGEMKKAINYTNEKEQTGYDFDFICCDKYGNYICAL